MELSELAQLSKGILALFRGGECEDAVWCPFVWAQDCGFRVFANEWKLF